MHELPDGLDDRLQVVIVAGYAALQLVQLGSQRGLA